MTKRSEQYDGHCLCGAVSVSVTLADPGQIGACHCGMCQRWSGGLFLCFAVDPAQVRVDGPAATFASSSFAERAFCGQCGTHLWMRDTAPGSDYEFMPGLFDAARTWPLSSEIYVDRAPAAVVLAGAHKRATGAEYEALNPHVEGDTP